MQKVVITDDQAARLANGEAIMLVPGGPDIPGDSRLRNSGRTTAAMLRVIADALLIPDEWVYFTDHDGPHSNYNVFQEQIHQIRDRLGLTLDVEAKARYIRVRSPLNRMRREHRAKLGASMLVEDSQQQIIADL